MCQYLHIILQILHLLYKYVYYLYNKALRIYIAGQTVEPNWLIFLNFLGQRRALQLAFIIVQL